MKRDWTPVDWLAMGCMVIMGLGALGMAIVAFSIWMLSGPAK